MKRTWKILILCVVMLTVLSLLVACGDDTPDNPDNPDNGGTKPGNTLEDGQYALNVTVSEVEFLEGGDLKMTTDASGRPVLYATESGDPYRLTEDNHIGSPDPDRAVLTYEYYLNGTKIVAYDENLDLVFGDEKYADGISEAGEYEVKLVYRMANHNSGVKIAKFVIEKSYTVKYEVGTPTGSGVPTMEIHEKSPTTFSTTTVNSTLYDPTMKSDTLGYNFRGWFLDKACTKPITAITGSDISADLIASGTLTLYAKFEACVAYPDPFKDPTAENRVTTEPTLPAIPGYEYMDENAFKLVDMSLLKDSGNAVGYGYMTNGHGVYELAKEPARQTEGGQYAVMWQDPADLWDTPLIGGTPGQVHVPGDGISGAQMILGALNGEGKPTLPLYNPTYYDTLEFWIYNANNVGNTVTLLVFMDGKDASSMYVDIKLDFSGWKKFSFHLSNFKTPTGFSFNITKIHFYGANLGGGSHSENADLCEDKNPNFVFISDIFVTNNTSSFSVNKPNGFTPNDSLMNDVFQKLGNMPVNATLSDDDIATILSDNLADNSAGDTGSFWTDIMPLNDSYNIMSSYERLMFMAEAWSDPDSAYYRSEDLKNTIAAGMNYMSKGANVLLTTAPDVDEFYEDAAYYLVKTTNYLSAFINQKHAETWMAPALYFVQAPCGSGDRLLKTAYTYACAQAALGNSSGFQTGIRAISAAFANNRITMSMNAANVVDALSLISVMDGTAYMPGNIDKFMTDFFNWFYFSVDSFLVDGTLPAALVSVCKYDLATYIRGMLMIYNMAPAAEQTKFAAAVNYYLAQDTTLKTTITDTAYYHAEVTALTAIEAKANAAAPSGANGLYHFESIGQVIVKTENGILLLDRKGTSVSTIPGVAVTAINCDKLYATMIGDVFAIAAPDRAVFITNGTVTEVEYDGTTNAATFDKDNIHIVVAAGTASTITTATGNGTITEASGAPMIAGTAVNADGETVLYVYNYTEATVDLTIVLNGVYSEPTGDNLYSVNDDGAKTTVTVGLFLTEKEVVRKSTNTVFEIVLESESEE